MIFVDFLPLEFWLFLFGSLGLVPFLTILFSFFVLSSCCGFFLLSILLSQSLSLSFSLFKLPCLSLFLLDLLGPLNVLDLFLFILPFLDLDLMLCGQLIHFIPDLVNLLLQLSSLLQQRRIVSIFQLLMNFFNSVLKVNDIIFNGLDFVVNVSDPISKCFSDVSQSLDRRSVGLDLGLLVI